MAGLHECPYCHYKFEDARSLVAHLDGGCPEQEESIRQEDHFIDYLMEEGDRKWSNAEWCEAEAIATDNEVKRDMLLKIAAADRAEAVKLIIDAGDRLTLLHIEFKEDE
jgi:hypothetical protein